MHGPRQPVGLAPLAALACLLCACQQQNQSMTMEQKIGPAQLTVTQIQSELMSYADTLATKVAEATDDVRSATDDPEVRAAAHGVKTSTALAAFTIASEQSPLAALLDMVVLVTLSYEVARDLWIPRGFGEQGQPIVDAFGAAKDDIWLIADKVLDPDGHQDLERLIREWREKHPGQKYVSHIRFSDFAAVRGQMGSATGGQGGNLLGLFMLDPLSKMTPATRQIEQSRLLGERLFYFSSRLPTLFSWEMESLAYELLATSEFRQLLQNTNQYAEVSQRLATLAEELPERVATERKAIIEETGVMIAEQRIAAIEQARQAVATEREALLADLNRQADALGPLVTELKAALDSGTALSNSIDGIVTKVQARRPVDARPLEMEDVRRSLVEATTTARELNTLTESLDRLLASSEPGRLAELQETLALAEASGYRLVNRIFVLALVLVAVIFAASLVMLLIRAPGRARKDLDHAGQVNPARSPGPMQISTMRRADRWLGVPLCAVLTIARRVRDALRGPAEGPVKRILFIKLAEQGSTVLATSALRRAAEMVGRENVYFLAFEENSFILRVMDIVDRANILTIRAEGLLGTAFGALKAIRRMRQLQIDATIDLEFFARSTAVLSALSGARRRVGFHAFGGEGPYRGNLMTHRLRINPHLHTSQTFRLMVEAVQQDPRALPTFDLVPPEIDDAPPSFTPGPEETAAARRLVADAAGTDEIAPLVLLNANCSDILPLRAWPRERYVELARRLLERFPDARIAMTGAPSEERPVRDLVAEIGSDRCFCLAGRTTLRELLVVYTFAELLVTNDSGPAHFATLTPIDVITLFGPEHPALFAARSPRNHVMFAGLACSPCVSALNNRTSTCTDNVCLQRIEVDTVFERACRLLAARAGREPAAAVEVKRPSRSA